MRKKRLRKGKYKVVNWRAYNESLEKRGDITIWFTEDGIEKWYEEEVRDKSKGKPRKYSDYAIQTAYILRQVFNLRLRQTEGFVKAILKLMKVELEVPDYTTVSRRIRELAVEFIFQKPKGAINMIIDSTGIKVVGEQEWIKHKHGGIFRKIWRKLHIGVTDDGSIIAGEVTTLRESDIAVTPKLFNQITNKVEFVVGDGGYFKNRMEASMKDHKNTKSARFIGPPGNGQINYGNRLKVEETFSRYKRIIGNKFKAQHFLGQQNEAKISLLILNIMKSIGMPKTIRIA